MSCQLDDSPKDISIYDTLNLLSGGDLEEEKEKSPAEGLFSEGVKKALYMGVGALFLTRDMLRSFLKEGKITEEILDPLWEEIQRGRGEVLRGIREVVQKNLQNIDLVRLVEEVFLHPRFPEMGRRFLEGLKMEWKGEVRFSFLKKEGGEVDHSSPKEPSQGKKEDSDPSHESF